METRFAFLDVKLECFFFIIDYINAKRNDIAYLRHIFIKMYYLYSLYVLIVHIETI